MHFLAGGPFPQVSVSISEVELTIALTHFAATRSCSRAVLLLSEEAAECLASDPVLTFHIARHYNLLGMVAHACNPSSAEADSEGLLCV